MDRWNFQIQLSDWWITASSDMEKLFLERLSGTDCELCFRLYFHKTVTKFRGVPKSTVLSYEHISISPGRDGKYRTQDLPILFFPSRARNG